ncbi:MAG: phosphoenolpyruvate carboxykinase [Fibrobacterota bacterium]
MNYREFVIEHEQIIIHTKGEICIRKEDLLRSGIFRHILKLYLEKLQSEEAPVLEMSGLQRITKTGRLGALYALLCELNAARLDAVAGKSLLVPKSFPDSQRTGLHEFVEGLYDFWRSFDRFMVLHAMPGPSGFEQRPYRSFNATIETLSHTVRALYRDICENIIGAHPRVYRQVSAGCNIGLIALPLTARMPKKYQAVSGDIPFIRQVWITPPMIMDPPMNVRTGRFERVPVNPLENVRLKKEEWLCYPACVGDLTIFVYFHQTFMGLGCTLANLFELASDESIEKGPDALYFFGMPETARCGCLDSKTVFYDDKKHDILVAAVPGRSDFGYFGYLKKMTLTLHNIIMMKRGRMPFHGAMVHISLRSGKQANVLVIGDTATGKSESLEALRMLGQKHISEMRIIADDMGSLEVRDGRVIGYGTEIGAFIRLDDLQQGYAFDQIDRAIIMSPQKVNARVVLPVTSFSEIVHGYPVDVLLYANNYEIVDETHPVLRRFETPVEAMKVFSVGAAMAKGTTTSTGLVHSYFANIFGPSQYRALHEPLALRTFKAAFRKKAWVGEIRTQLGVTGRETEGPRKAAEALLKLVEQS